MAIKIGINGMGRIGRMVIRAIIESKNKNIIIKHINNRSNSKVSCSLLKHDSIHGKFNANLSFDKNHLIINKNKISFSQESKIEDINWKKHDVDYVFECTGKFNSKEKLLTHIKNGAKKVIVSAPCKDADKTIVYGVNEKTIKKNDKIISAASCTTNCLAPVANILNNNFEILWSQQLGVRVSPKQCEVRAIALDSKNNVYVTGSTFSDFDENTRLNQRHENDIITVKFDKNGNKVWSKQFGTYTYDYGVDLSITKWDSVLVLGQTNNILLYKCISSE